MALWISRNKANDRIAMWERKPFQNKKIGFYYGEGAIVGKFLYMTLNKNKIKLKSGDLRKIKSIKIELE